MDEKLVENAEARVQALLEVTTALLALDDEAELKAVLNTQRAADVADRIGDDLASLFSLTLTPDYS